MGKNDGKESSDQIYSISISFLFKISELFLNEINLSICEKS